MHKLLLTAMASLSLTANATQSLIHYDCDTCQQLDGKEVNYDWVIKNTPIKQAKPLTRKSKSYQMLVTGKQLKQGIALFTQGNEAIIRIDGADKSLLSQQLTVSTVNNKNLSLSQASQQVVGNKELTTTPYFQTSQSIFQLKPTLGHGRITVKAQNFTGNDDKSYLIHVFDKNAVTDLSIKTDKVNYFYGDQVTVDVQVSGDQIIYPIIKISADIIDPDGKKYPLHLTKLGFDHYQAQTQINSKINTAGRNWYVRVDTESLAGEDIIYRHADTALSYTIPSAAFKEVRQVQSSHGIAFNADISTSTKSRYALEGILYGHDSNNQLRPVMVAQTAAMLSAGEHQLKLLFNQEKLDKSSLKPPYELKQVRIIDYGQLRQVTR